MTRRAEVSIYAREIRFKIGPAMFAWEDSFALMFENVSVVRTVNFPKIK
jgi:hypothetical protein